MADGKKVRDFSKQIERMRKAEPQEDTLSTHQTDVRNPRDTAQRLQSILPETDPAHISTRYASGCSDPTVFGTRIWIVMEHFEDPDPAVTYYSNFRGLFFSLEAATQHMHRLIRADHPKTYDTAEEYTKSMDMAEVFDDSSMPLGLGYRYKLGSGRSTRVLWLTGTLGWLVVAEINLTLLGGLGCST